MVQEPLTDQEVEELVAEFLEVESKVSNFFFALLYHSALFFFNFILEGLLKLTLGCRGSRSTGKGVSCKSRE
jgi:hypothetical protein